MNFPLKAQRSKKWFCLLICLMLLPVTAQAQLTDGEKCMVGVYRVSVRVVVTDEAKSLTGLDVNAVRQRVENKLKQAGLMILSEREGKREVGKPHIDVLIDHLPVIAHEGGEIDAEVITEELHFAQEVIPVRRKNVTVYRSVWISPPRATVIQSATPHNRISRVVINAVGNLVDTFLAAHRKANPKRRSGR